VPVLPVYWQYWHVVSYMSMRWISSGFNPRNNFFLLNAIRGLAFFFSLFSSLFLPPFFGPSLASREGQLPTCPPPGSATDIKVYCIYLPYKGAWLSEQLRRWSNKPGVVGSIPNTTEFLLISCDSDQVPKWFGTHYNHECNYPCTFNSVILPTPNFHDFVFEFHRLLF